MNIKYLLPVYSILLGLLAVALQWIVPKGWFHYQDEMLANVGLAGMLGGIALGILNYKRHKRLSCLCIVIGIVFLLLGLLGPAWFPARGLGSA